MTKEELINNYKQRLSVPIEQNIINLSTKSGLTIATGYTRIVIGGRGPYVEFSDAYIINRALFIPDKQQWRLSSSLSYYIEYRTLLDNVKVYKQLKTVGYADYKIGLYYISPFDLYIDGKVLITKKK